MYNYQTQILIEKNYDFSSVSPEKQKRLSEINGYDFSLIDLVQYLKKQSKNFKEHNPFLEAIDKSIVRAIDRHHKDTQTKNPLDANAPTVEDEARAKQISDIEDLIFVLQDIQDNEEAENLLETLQDTLVSLKEE